MLEKNIFTPNREMHPFNFTINNVVEILQRQAELQKITIEFEPLKTEVIVSIDMMRTQQIIINLLTNALKFSKAKDVIRVAASMETLEPSNSNEVVLCFKVSDNGIGISDRDLSNLFTPFFRSKEELNQEYNKNGNGLGLHICQKIVKQLGGKIDVQSTLG
jgi:two-component system, NarL family, sensor histidine kinase BarA